MNILPQEPIDSFTINVVADQEFNNLFHSLRPQVFSHFAEIDSDIFMTPNELEAADKLWQVSRNRGRINLVAFKDQQVVGWSFGRQQGRHTFQMVNSAVLPEFRRKGIYSALLKKMIESVRLAGFQIITSDHIATNNVIIIAKLKLGFNVTGFHVSDEFGTQVQLSYYFSEARKRLLQFRTGQTKPDESILAAMGYKHS